MRNMLVFCADVMELLAAETETAADALDAQREGLDECMSKQVTAQQRKLLDTAYAPGVRQNEEAVSLGRCLAAFYQSTIRIRLPLLCFTHWVFKRRETA